MRSGWERSAGDPEDPTADPSDEADRRTADAGAGVRIVLSVPSRARVAGAAVASGLSVARGEVVVTARWEDGGTDAGPVVPAANRDGTDATAGRGDGTEPPSVPWATRRARRAAVDVRRAGVEALATGNTVRVTLPDDEAQAVAAFERLTASPDHGPVVCVVARPWGGGWLRLIEAAGTVHVAGPASSVEASRAMLRRHDVHVVATPRPTGAVAAMLLRSGWSGRPLIRVPSDVGADGVGDGRGRTGADGRPEPDEEAQLRGREIGDDAGQALLLVLLGVTIAIVLAGILGAVAMAMSGREDQQRAVDVAALAAAAHLRAGASYGGRPSSGGHRTTARQRRARAVATARSTARENGVAFVEVDFPDGDAPQRVRVRTVHRPTVAGVVLASEVAATAEVAAPSYAEAVATGDEYAGPLAIRQGKPMRPDVALAFDRMNAAATAAGHPLTVTSGYRSNAEQTRLFAAHPDPKWVARPGTSLHRLGTELDLGPASAYGWLAANGRRFGFLRRYAWEPWHFGFVQATASAHVAEQGRNPAAPQANGTIPLWVPATYRDTIRAASIRFKVSAAMLSAQLKAESNFDPRAVSSAGAQGIAQFMPGTAVGVGLRDPFDPTQAIPAQAQLMARLLRRFGSVPLALAAYNAGEGRVGACHCVPPYPETQRYVARIIALMRGYDGGFDGAGLVIRLVG